MDDGGEGVTHVAVQQEIEADQVALLVVLQLIVEGGVAPAAGLEGVEEVVDDLVEGQGVEDLHPVLFDVVHMLEDAPVILAQLHDGSHEVRRGHDAGLDHGLLHVVDLGGVREAGGVVDDHGLAGHHLHPIDHGGAGGDEIEIEFPLQSLRDDLHVQKPQKAAAEAVPEGRAGLFLEGQGGVVQLQLFQGLHQVPVVGAVGGIDAAKDHGVHLHVAGQGLFGGMSHVRQGVAHLGLLHALDGGGYIAHLSGGELIHGLPLGGEDAHLGHVELVARGHGPDAHAGADSPVEHPHIGQRSLVVIVEAVEDQGLGGAVVVAAGGRYPVHDLGEHLLHVEAGLGRHPGRVLGGQADHVLDLMHDPLRLRGGQVDLVDDGQDLEVVVDGQVHVGQGLGFDALGGVHHQHRPLAGFQGTGDLVGEVHVARGVDEVEHILLPVGRGVEHAHSGGLDGDAPLPLDVHGIEELSLHVPLGYGIGELHHPIRQGGLAMVDMGDDAEIANMRLIHDGFLPKSYGISYPIPEKKARREETG